MKLLIFKFLFFCAIFFIIVFSGFDILNFIIEFNLNSIKVDLLGRTLIYFFEITVVLLLYDFILISIYVSLGSLLYKIGVLMVEKNKTSSALLLIRLDYYLLRVTKKIRLHWISYFNSATTNKLVWNGITKKTFSQSILAILRVLVSLPMFLAFLFAYISEVIIDERVHSVFSLSNKFVNDFSQSNSVKIGDIFLRLPGFVALITIIPLLFSFYFYSQKREVRKIIDKDKEEYFKKVVLEHDRLLNWIENNLFEISSNFDYIIKVQESLVELFLSKRFSNYYFLTHRHKTLNSYINPSKFQLIELKDIEVLNEIISNLRSEELNKYTKKFSIKRYDLWYFYTKFTPSLDKIESIDYSFFTKKWLENKVVKCSTNQQINILEEQLDEERVRWRSYLAQSIYGKLELLYQLERVRNTLRRYLYSSRVERLILKALNKDK